MINCSILNKQIEVLTGVHLKNNDASLGHFSVSTTATPSDIAKAAALTMYHDIDITSNNLFKFTIRWRKGIKSKFAKKSSDDDDESEDWDVDEATKEESVENEPRYQRNPTPILAKLAQRNADIINRRATFGR